jgi:hypothetical protein
MEYRARRLLGWLYEREMESETVEKISDISACWLT